MSGHADAQVAGWYADPTDDLSLRWWDGEHWTDRVRALPGPSGTPVRISVGAAAPEEPLALPAPSGSPVLADSTPTQVMAAATPSVSEPTAVDSPAPQASRTETEDQKAKKGLSGKPLVAVVVAVAIVAIGCGVGVAVALSNSHHSTQAVSSSTSAPATQVSSPAAASTQATSAPAPAPAPATSTVEVTVTPTPTLDRAEGAHQARALENLVYKSSDARAAISSVVSRVQSCDFTYDDIDTLNGIVQNRESLLDSLDTTPVDQIANGTTIVKRLRRALNYSLQADEEYQSWAEEVWDGTCDAGREHLAAAGVADSHATAAKTKFTHEWNSTGAKKYGVSDFKQSEI
jgi:hypothetical protein